MSVVPLLPETAPFSPEQRAWLNGFRYTFYAISYSAIKRTYKPS